MRKLVVIGYTVVEGGRPVMCGSLGATSTNQRYYTTVRASFDSASAWAVARNSRHRAG